MLIVFFVYRMQRDHFQSPHQVVATWTYQSTTPNIRLV
jgi:hypothetical protein